ncbi:TauD/TfdA family dioxygenase [Siccirubricoccus sp. KC 17139]|uniref:TauD/TfdA family dioxygenase n=1 Tax=Siccirubricoccus soli TaxID=2899147 RepID=A0ABT1D7B2_9PROT|nr:TauD/TfdA family dioxygenase [Siccirubricoccus soli]MCO6417769.1 TauD/TfdA family dioxygenase [Siccirubricoccus soli]MCP2683904.1 TauD/TfdA family dioxygenase [Siccirubricoccus soli]
MSAHLAAALPAAATALPFRPLHPEFGLELYGLDLAAPQPEAVLDRLVAALAEHQLLLLRDQALSPAQLAALAARLAHAPRALPTALAAPGDLAGWAFDPLSPRRPARVQALFAAAPPAPGLTGLFASQIAALAGLNPWLAYHVAYLEAATPAGPLPLVQADAAGHRRALFLPPEATALAGLPAAEAAALLPRLRAAATAPAITWRHGFRQGDLLLWDGHALLHRLAPGQAGAQAPLLRAAAAPEAPLGAAAATTPYLIAG